MTQPAYPDYTQIDVDDLEALTSAALRFHTVIMNAVQGATCMPGGLPADVATDCAAKLMNSLRKTIALQRRLRRDRTQSRTGDPPAVLAASAVTAEPRPRPPPDPDRLEPVERPERVEQPEEPERFDSVDGQDPLRVFLAICAEMTIHPEELLTYTPEAIRYFPRLAKHCPENSVIPKIGGEDAWLHLIEQARTLYAARASPPSG